MESAPFSAAFEPSAPRSRIKLTSSLSLSRHLAAAQRLRRRFEGRRVSAESVDAVLDTRGRVRHANGTAADRVNRDLLLRAARAMDHARTRRGRDDPLRAIQEWEGLVGHGWTLVEHFDRDGCRYVLAIDNRRKRPSIQLLSERERPVVEHALLGCPNKAIAYELGLAHLTVRVLIARAAAKVGAHSREQLLKKAARLAPRYGRVAQRGERRDAARVRRYTRNVASYDDILRVVYGRYAHVGEIVAVLKDRNPPPTPRPATWGGNSFSA
jgi:DNA-binding CsgD family transcriptional regulator